MRRTGDIGLITVLGDSGVAAGVRRIEALTAKGARQHARTNANLVAGVADALHVGPHEVFTRIEALVDAIASELGGITILVNNAGITRDNLLMRMKDEDWQAILDTNLTSVFRASKAVLRLSLIHI